MTTTTTDPKATPAIIPTDAEMDKMAQLIGLDFPVSEMQRIFARHQQDREKIATLEADKEALRLIVDGVKHDPQCNAEFADHGDCMRCRLAQAEARVKELEQIMMLHFITTGDDGMPVDEQGRKRARDFKDECGRIIMAAADRCEKELESR